MNRSDNDYAKNRDAIDDQMNDMLEAKKFENVVGCFEGAGYSSEGVYRPSLNCRMFSKSLVEFCPVCERSIERVIDYYIE